MRIWLGVAIALIGFSMIAIDAEAARLGGGRSVGRQREAIGQQRTAPPAQQPHQAQNTPTPQQQPAQAARPQQPTPQPSGFRRWLGPLAGLAIGAGLAALFFHNGMGGALMGILLLVAIVFGVIMLVRLFRGGARAANDPMRYAGASPYGRTEPVSAMPPTPAYGAAAPNSVAATTAGGATPANRFPPDFDATDFARHAKANFVKLQEAHDRKDIGAIRDFLTPEMSREIEADMRAGGDAPQKTDVVTLDADVLDLARENGSYVVSVKFSGLIRERPGDAPQPFSEIWHLEKPADGSSGWQVAGIQQA